MVGGSELGDLRLEIAQDESRPLVVAEISYRQSQAEKQLGQ